jgi:hypothetical protein
MKVVDPHCSFQLSKRLSLVRRVINDLRDRGPLRLRPLQSRRNENGMRLFAHGKRKFNDDSFMHLRIGNRKYA